MIRTLLTATAALALTLGVADGPVTAEPRTPATYDGKTIDLADGDWEGAQVCVVLDRDTIECFDTETQAASAVDGYDLEGPVEPQSTTACYWNTSSFLYLYSSTGFSGTALALNQTGQWDNLATYGFDNRTSSYRNLTDCNGVFADGSTGSGAQRTFSASSAMSAIGTWDNRISSVCLSGPPGGGC